MTIALAAELQHQAHTLRTWALADQAALAATPAAAALPVIITQVAEQMAQVGHVGAVFDAPAPPATGSAGWLQGLVQYGQDLLDTYHRWRATWRAGDTFPGLKHEPGALGDFARAFNETTEQVEAVQGRISDLQDWEFPALPWGTIALVGAFVVVVLVATR